MQYQEAYNRLEQYGQTHLLRYYDTLSAAEQAALLQQISEMDFSVLERAAHEEAPKGKIEPLGACTISEIAGYLPENWSGCHPQGQCWGCFAGRRSGQPVGL